MIWAQGCGGPPGDFNRLPRPAQKGAEDSSWATTVCRHKSLSFAHVFKPCKFKHSRDFKALKHKMWKSCTCAVCTLRAVSHSPRTPNWVLPLLAIKLTNTNKMMLQYPSWWEKLLVMSEQNVNRKQMYIIILDALALKVTMPNLLAVGVLNINPRKYRENHSLLLTELLCIFNKNESIFNLYSE